MRKPALLAFLALCILPSFAQSPKPPAEFNPAKLEIPADSESPYDFRGKPDFAYAPYEALYQTKTVGDLYEKLREFFKAWAKDGRKFDDPVATDRYFRCKQALIRVYYLCGRMEEGDRLMQEFHPSRQANAADPIKAMQAAGEQEKIARTVERIRGTYSQLGVKEDPYPNGAPKDIHELYAPLFKLLNDLAGGH